MSATPFWQSFPADPRLPANARMRASDADRAVVSQLLTEAYADGRLTRDELDERTTAAAQARTLGDLPPLVDDLVGPVDALPVAAGGSVPATPDEIRGQAEAAWRRDRSEALWGFLGPTAICLVIWGQVMFGQFFWPGFVMLGTGINLVRVVARRDDIVADHVRRLEKKQAKALREAERRRVREIEPRED